MPTTIIDIPIPNYVRTALAALEASGQEAWLVGECVRDVMQSRPVSSYRMITSASCEKARQALCNCGITVSRVGDDQGSLIASTGEWTLEVKPCSAANSAHTWHLKEELSDRDFTINALAYHPERGMFDYFDGLRDLRNGTIRTIGDPFTSFRKDPLCILTGCKLASQLGFTIEPHTLQIMVACKMGLLHVSPEAITNELDELLRGDYVHDALMATIDVLVAVMPEIAACKGFAQQTPYHIYDVWEHTAWVVQRSPATSLSRWSALFHDIGKPAACILEGKRTHFYGHPKLSAIMAADIMRRLQFESEFSERVLTLVKMHDVQIAATPETVGEALARIGGDADLFRALIRLKRADALSQSDLSEPRLRLSYELEQVLNKLVDPSGEMPKESPQVLS